MVADLHLLLAYLDGLPCLEGRVGNEIFYIKRRVLVYFAAALYPDLVGGYTSSNCWVPYHDDGLRLRSRFSNGEDYDLRGGLTRISNNPSKVMASRRANTFDI